MAAAEEQEENHWPGFVDALSTIVMVVTFLLIILAVAIFALSLNVAKVATASTVPAETTNLDFKTEIQVASNPVELDVTAPARTIIRSDKAIVLRFEGTTLDIDEAAQEQLASFFEAHRDDLSGAELVVTGYFDPEDGSYAKRQRISYYRVMTIRNQLLQGGYAGDKVRVYVREAPSSSQIDTVEITRKS